MHVALDYPTLRVIWWVLLGVLLIGFALTDGWDLGIGAVLPFVARTDVERRMVINVAGPTWEGNQVWFILGGGAIFAAWPFVYAASFSGFYLAMFLVLAALILRPVGFKYRSKKPEARWRASWDWALFAGGLVPSLVFGVAVGNVLEGAPFRIDGDLRFFYEGGFFDLFTPFTLLCGLLSVAMIVLHGTSYLAVRVEHGAVRVRARRIGTASAGIAAVLFALGGLEIAWGHLGYQVMQPAALDGPSNPRFWSSVHADGTWLSNDAAHPWMIAAPILGFAGVFVSIVGIRAGRDVPALLGSSLATFGIIATVGLSMFPFILPSSIDAHSSLLVWNASSSARTLLIMLIATVVFLPIVLVYTAWVYRVIWGRVTTGDIAIDPDLY